MRLLTPHQRAASVYHIDYDSLWEEGLRGVIFDLDNTLCRWRAPQLDEHAAGLLWRLRTQGFRLAVLTNGRPAGRERLADQLSSLQVPLIWTARKPWPSGFRRALKSMNMDAGLVAMVGDQVFTDLLGARIVGIPMVLVQPIGQREHPATRVLRCLERLAGRSSLSGHS